MSDTYAARARRGATRAEDVPAAAARGADWLGLAAAPTFAAMALVTGLIGGSAMHGSPLTGMVPMYLLMAAFHAPPWLRLIARRQDRAGALTCES